MSATSEAASPGGGEWSTVQSSKPRRLVPQFSLSRQNLGADNSTPSNNSSSAVGEAGDATNAAPSAGTGSFGGGSSGNVGYRGSGLGDAPRRRVLRYTREEMLTYRRPGRILPVMSNMLEVASLESLDPVCFTPFDAEDVARIYAADRKGGGDPASRGTKNSARSGQHRKDEDDGMDGDGDWSRSNRAQDGRSSSLWDDGPGTGMGLEQFAAKALQFRQDMEELKIRGDEDVMAAAARAAEEDNMERLIRDEEAYRAGVAAGAAGGGSRGGGGGAGGCLEGVLGDGEDSLGGLVQGELDVEDEDEELPDWADDDAEADADGALAETAAPQESKRNLLMETLNVKSFNPAPSEAAPSAQREVSASQALSAALGLLAQQPAPDQLLASQQQQQQLAQQQLLLQQQQQQLEEEQERQKLEQQQHERRQQQLEIERKQQLLMQEQLIREQQHIQQQQLLQRQMQAALVNGVTIPAPPPPQLMGPPEWYYMDPQGQVQGPFSQDNMRMWHGAGYFNAELPIKMRHWSSFHRFRFVFSDLQTAFAAVPHEPGSMYAVQQAQHEQEKQRMRQQLLEQQRIQQQQQQQAFEEQRKKLAEEAERQKQLALEEELRVQQLAEEKEKQRKLRELQMAQELQAKEEERKRLEEETRRQQQQQQQQKQQEEEKQRRQAAEKQKRAEEQRQKALSQQQHQQQQQQLAKQEEDKKSARQSNPPHPAAAAPWAKSSAAVAKTPKESLADIQKAEEERLLREREQKEKEQARAATAWQKKQGSSATNLAEIQEEEEKRRQAQAAQQPVRAVPSQSPSAAGGIASFQLKSLLGVKPSASAPAAPSASPSGSAWAVPKAAAAAKGSTGSLKDIMSQEDAKRQQEEEEAQAKALPVAKKGSSWAAKASIGVNPTNYAPAPSVSSPLANSMKPRGAVQEQPQQQQQQPIPAKTRAASREKTSGSNGANSTATGFGGKEMSREMAEWCASNLKKINGSDDITLMQFCMSLNSAIEIREYLAEYLGSSPQVVNFATEFIKYKEGGKRSQIISDIAVPEAGSGPAAEETGFISASKKKKPSK